MNQTFKTSQGFTLVEVIISIAILSVSSVVALQLFITAQNLNTFSRHSDIASVLATNTIEEIKSYDDLASLFSKTSSYESVDDGYRQIIYLDVNFQVSDPTSSNNPSNYSLNTDLTSTEQLGLYHIHTSVIDLTEDKVLADYLTAHYFNQEVSND